MYKYHKAGSDQKDPLFESSYQKHSSILKRAPHRTKGSVLDASFFLSSNFSFVKETLEAPLSEEILLSEAKKSRLEGNLDSALNFLSLLQKQDPHFVELFLEKGRVYEILGDMSNVDSRRSFCYTQALSSLQQGVILSEKTSSSDLLKDTEKQEMLGSLWHHKGQIYAKHGQYLKAAKAMDSALYHDPFRLGSWDARGIIALYQKNPQEALECFEAALHVSPDHVPAMIYRELLSKNKKSLVNSWDDYFLFHFFSHLQSNLEILEKGLKMPHDSISLHKRDKIVHRLKEWAKTKAFIPHYAKGLESLITFLNYF